MILVFDTETTGLPGKPTAPLESQPYIMQLAISLFNFERRPVFEISTLVRLPAGIEPGYHAFQAHGISAEDCATFGIAPKTALALMQFALDRATTTVAHNLQFDEKLLGFMAAREGQPIKLINPFCTMKACTDVVKMPPTPKMVASGRNNFKPPQLGECWRYFFGEELEGAHDALVDTRGAARVFFELADRGLIAKQS